MPLDGQFLCCALSVQFMCLRRSDRRESDDMGHVYMYQIAKAERTPRKISQLWTSTNCLGTGFSGKDRPTNTLSKVENPIPPTQIIKQ